MELTFLQHLDGIFGAQTFTFFRHIPWKFMAGRSTFLWKWSLYRGYVVQFWEGYVESNADAFWVWEAHFLKAQVHALIKRALQVLHWFGMWWSLQLIQTKAPLKSSSIFLGWFLGLPIVLGDGECFFFRLTSKIQEHVSEKHMFASKWWAQSKGLPEVL